MLLTKKQINKERKKEIERKQYPVAARPPSGGGVIIISVGAESTLGEQEIFARKHMHEKLTKFPNFT